MNILLTAVVLFTSEESQTEHKNYMNAFEPLTRNKYKKRIKTYSGRSLYNNVFTSYVSSPLRDRTLAVLIKTY